MVLLLGSLFSGDKSTWEWVVDWIGAFGAAATAVALLFVVLAWRSSLEETKQLARQLEEAQRGRQMQVLLDMARRWDEPALQKARRACGKAHKAGDFASEFMAKHEESSKNYFTYQRVGNFFEDLGQLVKMEMVTVEAVSEVLGNSALFWWEVFEPVAEAYDQWVRSNKEGPRDKTYKNFGLLAQSLTDFRTQDRA